MNKIDGLQELIQKSEELLKDKKVQVFMDELESLKTMRAKVEGFIEKEEELGQYLKTNSLLPVLDNDCFQLLRDVQHTRIMEPNLSILLANILLENFGNEKKEELLWNIIYQSIQESFHQNLAKSNRFIEYARGIKKRRLEQGKKIIPA